MSESVDTGEREDRVARLDILIVVLLGLVSVATAYTSFQASLYDGQMASAYTQAQNAQTEAESLYLEANQQYAQDSQTLTRLSELAIDAESPDPAVAAAASEKYDELYFTSVSEDLDAAITWADAENAGDPDTYTSPLDSEDYQAALFGAWSDEDDRSDALVADGERNNALGDRLTLATALMAITLFLLGVAAVVRRPRTKVILLVFGMGIFLGAAVIAAFVPFVWL